MTSVWPALWPPWKRTTPCALSVSQSTILPLPSSPHWVPMTTTFLPMRPMVLQRNASRVRRAISVKRCAESTHVGELAQVERESGRRPRAAERLADAVVAAAVADRDRVSPAVNTEKIAPFW